MERVTASLRTKIGEKNERKKSKRKRSVEGCGRKQQKKGVNLKTTVNPIKSVDEEKLEALASPMPGRKCHCQRGRS